MTRKNIPTAAQRAQHQAPSIFAEMSRLAREHNAVNLGQGFPDFDAPDFVKKALTEATEAGYNQYALLAGERILRNALAERYSQRYQLTIDIEQEITITNGATQAIWCAIQAVCNPGEAVIVFEPCYDSYLPAIRNAGATAVPVCLHAPEYRLNLSELEQAFATNTIKALLLNSPHNPTGTVFTREELEHIATLCKQYNCIVITDEVYEELSYNLIPHIPMATLPEMFERTITISSAGKTFGITGWKVGWVIASEYWQRAIRSLHQYMVFAVHTPSQYALGKILSTSGEYIASFNSSFIAKRDMLASILTDCGYTITKPDGGYFIMADYSNLDSCSPAEYAKKLLIDKGVACIPPETFYVRAENIPTAVRFAFCKKDSTIIEAGKRLLSA